MKNTATFSKCRKYRYSLWRNWGGLFSSGKYVMFIGLNPSTADERSDDPTIRRCVSFAKSWGYDSLCMTNIFAYRATEPKDMLSQKEPAGKDNDRVLVELAANASVVIASWGVYGKHLGRDKYVIDLIKGLHYLILTKDGYPGHPLYLPGCLRPKPWSLVCL